MANAPMGDIMLKGQWNWQLPHYARYSILTGHEPITPSSWQSISPTVAELQVTEPKRDTEPAPPPVEDYDLESVLEFYGPKDRLSWSSSAKSERAKAEVALAGATIIHFDSRDDGYYSENWQLIYRDASGDLWEDAGSHCSCNGVEFEPGRVTLKSLLMRPDEDDESRYSCPSMTKELRAKLLKLIPEPEAVHVEEEDDVDEEDDDAAGWVRIYTLQRLETDLRSLVEEMQKGYPARGRVIMDLQAAIDRVRSVLPKQAREGTDVPLRYARSQGICCG